MLHQLDAKGLDILLPVSSPSEFLTLWRLLLAKFLDVHQLAYLAVRVGGVGPSHATTEKKIKFS